MESSPKDSLGPHSASAEDKEVSDNPLRLFSAPAMGESHHVNRGKTLALEEPHYCHGHLSFPGCCLARDRCFGGLGGVRVLGEDGIWSTELCCSDSLSGSVHTGETV